MTTTIDSWAWVSTTTDNAPLSETSLIGTQVPIGNYINDFSFVDADDDGIILDTDAVDNSTSPTTPPPGEGMLIDGVFVQVVTFSNWNGVMTFADGTTYNIGLVVFLTSDGRLIYRLGDPNIATLISLNLFRAQLVSFEITGFKSFYARTNPYNVDNPWICFCAGSMLDTPDGPRDVADLKVGDKVYTVDHGARPVKWIGKRAFTFDELTSCENLRPVRIAANAMGKNIPEEDTLFSPLHRVMVRSAVAERMIGSSEALVPAKHLIGHKGIEQVLPEAGVVYVHVALDRHEVLNVNNMRAESLYPGRQALNLLGKEAKEELLHVFPELKRGEVITAARPFFGRSKTRSFVERILKNNKPAYDAV